MPQRAAQSEGAPGRRPLVPIRATLGEVIVTPVENMHKAGYSFSELYAIAVKMGDIPQDFMPSESLVGRLLFQFWNYQEDLADEADAKASKVQDDLRPAHLS